MGKMGDSGKNIIVISATSIDKWARSNCTQKLGLGTRSLWAFSFSFPSAPINEELQQGQLMK